MANGYTPAENARRIGRIEHRMDMVEETIHKQGRDIAILQSWRDNEIEARRRAAQTMERQAIPDDWRWRWVLIIAGSMAVGAWILIQLQATL